jgi:hypothetical protein
MRKADIVRRTAGATDLTQVQAEEETAPLLRLTIRFSARSKG